MMNRCHEYNAISLRPLDDQTQSLSFPSNLEKKLPVPRVTSPPRGGKCSSKNRKKLFFECVERGPGERPGRGSNGRFPVLQECYGAEDSSEERRCWSGVRVGGGRDGEGAGSASSRRRGRHHHRGGSQRHGRVGGARVGHFCV